MELNIVYEFFTKFLLHFWPWIKLSTCVLVMVPYLSTTAELTTFWHSNAGTRKKTNHPHKGRTDT